MSDNDSSSSSSSSSNEESNEESSNIEVSSTSQSGSGAKGYNDTEETTDAIKQQLSKRETKAVLRLRILVIVILFIAAVSVSLVVYLITSRAERDKFTTQYEGTAQKVVDSYEGIMDRMGSISSIGVAAVIQGMDDNQSWPFITLSSLQQRTSTARILSGALYVSINPIVNDDQREDWELYVGGKANSWMTEAYAYQADLELNDFEYDPPPLFNGKELSTVTGNSIVSYSENQTSVHVDEGPGPYMPRWMTSPYLRTQILNLNLLKDYGIAKMVQTSVESRSAILGGYWYAPPGPNSAPNPTTRLFAVLRSFVEKQPVSYLGDPMARLFIPLFSSFQENQEAGAIMTSVIHWRSYFRKILPNNVRGIVAVLESSCDGSFSYQIDGEEAYVLGFGDHHDKKYDYLERTGKFSSKGAITDGTKYGLDLNQDICHYTLHVFPSREFEHQYLTNTPILITFSVAMVFLFMVIMFLVYDRLVERRQRLVLAKAAQSTAIVSSLFPKNVRDRLLHNNDGNNLIAPNHRLKSFLNGDAKQDENNHQPIADLFPHCTVLFADIAGFTAWSSTREPEQVFVLLQTVYQAFDQIAKRRRVFKVETIGDSYVAVTGLPEAQPAHAVIMARFAYECMGKMEEVVKDLETSLGPDTGDLIMRFGLHSGPVTAGVLRGDRARFQLFGDTVNTAARMESTGQRGKIQVSQSTADALVLAGKEHWIRAREDTVQAKGKGILRTFWLNPGAKKGSSQTSSSNGDAGEENATSSPIVKQDETMIKHERLVGWMVELLIDQLKKIIVRRTASSRPSGSFVSALPADHTYLDEVADSLVMPKFDADAMQMEDPRNIVIDSEIVAALRTYVSAIASTYRDNPFHNFEHACHVTMSVNKLLKRIVTPDIDMNELRNNGTTDIASHLYHFTHGISTDPMTLFAIVFSALIHDADHRGVSNAQLIKEDTQLAARFKNKSVAEQHSIDVAWNFLMEDRFENLRKFIFVTEAEMTRFRQIIVNVVLATDIFDKELNDLRKMRWERAFSNAQADAGNSDLKATIVIEHIIQASDVAHTMQHWHIYRKWNQRLFVELYNAFKAGRMGADPSTFWYKGEIGFFDNYIIPLAKKLKECNVFGVSSDEYLNYAVRNRAEWEERGQEIVEEMMQELL